MGTEHALATSCPVFVHAMLHGEWIRARRCLYDPVYISLLGPCLRLTRSCRLTMPRPNHLSELPLMLRSFFTIRLSLPGLHRHTRAAPVCLSGLLNMSKSLLGKPGFSSNNLEENCHVLSAAVGIGRLNGHAHKSPPLQFG